MKPDGIATATETSIEETICGLSSFHCTFTCGTDLN